MREISFSSTDSKLFDCDISSLDYEFYQKHKGAFKGMLEDQSEQQKQLFVNAFRDFSINYGCMKDFPLKKRENLDSLLDSVVKYLNEHFVRGKVSKAKGLLRDVVCLAQNRGLLQYVDSSSYAKDPFIHKDTRDVFRRLFGEPTSQDACFKAVCLLPLYVKFGGSICRYLRLWVEAGKVDNLGMTSSTALPSSAVLKSKSMSTESGKKTTKSTTKSTPSNKPASNSSSNTTVTKASVESPASGEKPTGSDSDDDDEEEEEEEEDEEEEEEEEGDEEEEQEEEEKEDEDEEEDEEEEEENWHTKVIRGIQSVLTAERSSGPSPIEYMEVYKRDKDGSYRRLREDFHLDKPHPNQEFEERCRRKEEERIEGNRLHEVIMKDYIESPVHGKRRQCANCKKVEKIPGIYKKCERCKGKGTKFYCSRECQGEDWVSRHRQDHSTVEQPS